MQVKKRMKKQGTVWEKIFTNYIPDKVPAPRLYKEFSKLSNKKTNYPI